MTAPCPVCGKADGACVGDSTLAFPPIHAIGEKGFDSMAEDKKIYVPKQRTRRGVAGYKGDNIVVVDAKGKETPASKTKARGEG